jgi:hypothetical protein
MTTTKSPARLALETLGHQRAECISLLQLRLADSFASASLFSIYRNLLNDHESFLRGQLKSEEEALLDMDVISTSPVTPNNIKSTSPQPSPAATPPAKSSSFAKALSLVLLFLLPTLTFAHGSKTLRSPGSHTPVIPTNNHPHFLTSTNLPSVSSPSAPLLTFFSLQTPFFSAISSPLPQIHNHSLHPST